MKIEYLVGFMPENADAATEWLNIYGHAEWMIVDVTGSRVILERQVEDPADAEHNRKLARWLVAAVLFGALVLLTLWRLRAGL